MHPVIRINNSKRQKINTHTRREHAKIYVVRQTVYLHEEKERERDKIHSIQ